MPAAEKKAEGADAKKGLHDAAPRDSIVDDYPERPYSAAMTAEQKDLLDRTGRLR